MINSSFEDFYKKSFNFELEKIKFVKYVSNLSLGLKKQERCGVLAYERLTEPRVTME